MNLSRRAFIRSVVGGLACSVLPTLAKAESQATLIMPDGPVVFINGHLMPCRRVQVYPSNFRPMYESQLCIRYSEDDRIKIEKQECPYVEKSSYFIGHQVVEVYTDKGRQVFACQGPWGWLPDGSGLGSLWFNVVHSFTYDNSFTHI